MRGMGGWLVWCACASVQVCVDVYQMVLRFKGFPYQINYRSQLLSLCHVAAVKSLPVVVAFIFSGPSGLYDSQLF